MTFHIITLFPESFSYLEQSILGRAQKNKKIRVKFYNPRDFTIDKHRTIDDKPYGGGAGMVLKPEPILQAVDSIKKKKIKGKTKIVILSAKGKQFTQRCAYTWARNFERIIFIAGRYEGVDERVRIALNAEEISIGPYVLTDGEVATMAIVSAVSRLLPHVIRLESLEEESFFGNVLKKEVGSRDNQLEYPHYTRPEVFEYRKKKYRVPKVLLSGDHKKIEDWREKH